MSDFPRALAFVLRWEGGRVDDPHDRGGPTKRGVTQRTYDGWRDQKGLPHRDVWDIEDDEVETVYRELYWWPARGLPWPLNLVVFDSAVLFGAGRAGSWLSAVSWRDAAPEAQAWAVCCLRRERHREAVAKDKTQARFWSGWLNRLEALAEEAGLLETGKRDGSDGAQVETGQQTEKLPKLDVASSTLVARSIFSLRRQSHERSRRHRHAEESVVVLRGLRAGVLSSVAWSGC